MIGRHKKLKYPKKKPKVVPTDAGFNGFRRTQEGLLAKLKQVHGEIAPSPAQIKALAALRIEYPKEMRKLEIKFMVREIEIYEDKKLALQ